MMGWGYVGEEMGEELGGWRRREQERELRVASGSLKDEARGMVKVSPRTWGRARPRVSRGSSVCR